MVAPVKGRPFFLEPTLFGSVELLGGSIKFLLVLLFALGIFAPATPVLFRLVEAVNVSFVGIKVTVGCEELLPDLHIVHLGLLLDLWQLLLFELFKRLIQNVPVLKVGLLVIV